MINALSVDVEDWYQVSDFEDEVQFSRWDQYESRVVRNTNRLLKLLARYDVRGTFFILTWNAERFPELVKEISAAGHEVATHGYAHRLIYTQTPDQFRSDIERSIETLEQLTGQKVLGYRAPSFSITKDSLWALDALLELGLQYDSSIFPLHDRLYGIADNCRFPYVARRNGTRMLIEFPMSTMRLAGRNFPLAGGAYLRVLPYCYIRWGLRRLNREGQPAIIYLHPWEIDPHQPRLSAKGKRGYSSHYLKLDQMENKLDSLLSDFSFAPVNKVLDMAMDRG